MKISSKLFFISIVLLFLCLFSADKVFPGWFKHYGGTQEDSAWSIQQTSDGGYIVAGSTYSYSHGSYDFAIYRLNSSGNKNWFKHYGGTAIDKANSIQQTSDGGYVVSGYTESFTNGNADFAIYRLDSNGNKLWFKHYGGTNDDFGHTVQQTSDGGYVIAGTTDSYTYGIYDIAIYKLNSSGNKVWFRHYGGTSGDHGYSIQQTSDGGCIVAGRTYSYSHGSYDFAIYKLNSNGNKVWFKHYGGSGNDETYSIQQTSDGGYIVGGSTKSYTYGDFDFAIYKLDSSGDKVWFRHYGGTGIDKGWCIQQTSGGGYIVAGHTESYTYGNEDFVIYKLNSNGNKVWFKHYGGTGNERAYSIKQTSEGGYIVAGATNSYTHGGYDFAIYKLNSDGNK